MDVAFILDKYFKGKENVSIDVFDAQTLNTVYRDVVNALTSHFEIEVSVIWKLVLARKLTLTKLLITEPMLKKNITRHLLKQEN